MIRLLSSFSGSVSRQAYVGVAFVCAIVKHIVDLGVADFLFHRPWGPLNYIFPLGVPVTMQAMTPDDVKFLATMVALSLPFAWIGVAVTAKRFRTIGWPVWLVILFFVPIANIASFVVAAAWPERDREGDAVPLGPLARVIPRDRFGSAVASVALSVALTVVFVIFGTYVHPAYGWGLFAAVPFVQGALAVFIFNFHERRTLGEDLGVAALSILLAGGAVLAVGIEGAVCLAMAMPLALCFALIGAAFAHTVTRRSLPGHASVLMLVLIAPVLMGAEQRLPREASLHEVVTSIVIDAPPLEVWKHVVDFPSLPPPTELAFRIGVSYPKRAKIVGRGVGATRYCEFSTGDFVEPITAWQPGSRLAFNVVQNAEPMREWSPYGHIDTPHMHGYLVSRRGEFVLEPLPGGRTLLVGRTWYQHHLWPDAYWTLWSNDIIHQIHARVLRHIKAISERAVQPTGAKMPTFGRPLRAGHDGA